MRHGLVDVFAYQEALLIEAAFGVAILFMLWAGFRRWLRHKETVDRLTAERTGEQMKQFDERLKAVERFSGNGTVPAVAEDQIDRNPTA